MKRYLPDQCTTPSADSITEKSPSDRSKTIGWVELGVFAVILIGATVLHIVFYMHSGGFWRDEVTSLNISNLPTLSDLWGMLQFESFPILWPLILRAWVVIGFGETDIALRTLGLIIGLGIAGTLWIVGRNLKMRLPLVSLVLVALCPTVLWGDTLRAYGLGVILILLAMGSLWRALEDPVPRKMLVSLVTAVLSVQCLYHNSFLLFALCLGGAAVGLYRRRWKLVLFPLGVGAIAALSVAPYSLIVAETRAWNIIIREPISILQILGKLRQAVDPADLFLWVLWSFLLLLVVFVFFRALVSSSRGRTGERANLVLFLLVTMLVGIVSYVTFIKILSYPTQIWYYLPLMAVLAVIADKGVDTVCEKKIVRRYVRVACVTGMAAFIFVGSWDAAHVRRTNMDLLSDKLESITQMDDLIVVFPFYYGISFARYYTGVAKWVTLPDLADHSVHRYDLFKDKMAQVDPIGPVIEEILQTLKRGNRVWWVGRLVFLRRGEAPGDLPPAPHSSHGWDEYAYQKNWVRKAAFTLQMHVKMLRRIQIPAEGPVSGFENVSLFEGEGWR